MVFSTETIKASRIKGSRSLYNRNIKESFIDNNDKMISTVNECYTITEDNIDSYKDILVKLISDNIAAIRNIFNINNTFSKDHYNMDCEPNLFHYKLRSLDTIDFSDVVSTPLVFKNKYQPELYLVEISHIINNLFNLNQTDDNGVIIDGEFLIGYPDGKVELSKEDIMDRCVFTDYRNTNNKYLCYITEYLSNLAMVIPTLPSINSIGNNSAVDIPKLVSVLNYKIKIIQSLFENFIKYTINYLNASNVIYDQNIRMATYICNNNFRDNIDAETIINEPENDIDECTLFNELDNAFNEAYNNELGLESLTESAGLIALEEAGKINISQYITKVSKGIKVAWDKFSQKVGTLKKKAEVKFIDKFKKNAESLPDDFQFTVQNYPDINESRFNSVKVIPFNYEEMKEFLKSSDAFTAHYYPTIRKEGVPFKKALEENLVNSRNDFKVTKTSIIEIVIPVFDEARNILVESIKADLETVNKSNESISRLSSTQGGGTTPPPAVDVNKESAIITEADDDDRPKIVDDPDRQATADKNSTLKDISVYLTTSSTILSTKMKLASQSYLLAFRILAHTFAPPKKNREET